MRLLITLLLSVLTVYTKIFIFFRCGKWPLVSNCIRLKDMKLLFIRSVPIPGKMFMYEVQF